MQKQTIVIPMAPVSKGRPRLTTRGGFARAYTPKRTREAEEKIREALKEQWHHEPLECPVALEMMFYMPIPKSTPKKQYSAVLGAWHVKKPDIDNCIKLVSDAANGILWGDDSQVCSILAMKKMDKDPRIEITISW